MATTYGCCGSTKKSACWEDISAAICATPGDYDGSHEYDPGNILIITYHQTCKIFPFSIYLTVTENRDNRIFAHVHHLFFFSFASM